MIVVIESFKYVRPRRIQRHLRDGDSLYVMEPFVAFHHTEGPIRTFLTEVPPAYAQRMIDGGTIKILAASELDPPAIYGSAISRAVQVVEQAFAHYRRMFGPFCRHVAAVLRSADAERVFKRNLCERIGVFLSTNDTWCRVGNHFTGRSVTAYPVTDAHEYGQMMKLLAAADIPFDRHPNVVFHRRARAAGRLRSLAQSVALTAKLMGQCLGSCLGGWRSGPAERPAKTYTYGITIVSPTRQLADNRRGPEFLIDGDRIKAEEVVLLPLVPLDRRRLERMRQLPCDFYLATEDRGPFSNPAAWLGLVRRALTCRFLGNGKAISLSANLLLGYFRWQRIVRQVPFRHLVSHCDFSLGHIGRNIALSQAGVRTWYFTDAMNFGINYMTDPGTMRHPYWTYMHYDHFVTWHQVLADYFGSHPGVTWQPHVVGCLWADRGPPRNSHRPADGLFQIAVFDGTYGRNFTCSYEEGIRFAEDILRLVEANPGLRVALKEKKQRDIHSKLDYLLGPQLVEQYDRMSAHPRIEIMPHGADASELISASGLVISFPFTSTTYEALAVNRPALWYDPMGQYGGTPYGKLGGVIAHGYAELESRVRELTAGGPGAFSHAIPADSPLMDPFRDGKAIDRFRQLLVSSD